MVGELAYAPLSGQHGAYLRVQVAQEVLGIPDVGGHHLEQVVSRHVAVVNPERRDAQPLVEYLAGGRVVAAVRASAYVGVVRPVHSHERQVAVHEHGPDHREVGQVRAAEVGIVEEEHVARRDVVAEVVQNGASGYGERADVHGYALALRDEPALSVQDGRRKVPAGVQYLRKRGTEHHVHHLYGDRLQPVSDHRQSDRVRLGVVRLPRSSRHFYVQYSVFVVACRAALADDHGVVVRVDDGRAVRDRIGLQSVHSSVIRRILVFDCSAADAC